MIPSYSMIPIYLMINWKYGPWWSKSLRWYLHQCWSCFSHHVGVNIEQEMIWTSADWSVVKHCLAPWYQELFSDTLYHFGLNTERQLPFLNKDTFIRKSDTFYGAASPWPLQSSLRSFVWFAFVGLCFSFSFSYFILWKIDNNMNGTFLNAQIKWAQTRQTCGYVETKKSLRIKQWCMWAKTPLQMQ